VAEVRRFLLLAAAAALLATGCSNPRSGSLGPAPTAGSASAATGDRSRLPASPVSPTPGPGTTTASARPGSISIELWFGRGGRLSPTRRTRPATLATSRLALTELIAGPSAAEQRAGLSTSLPPDAGFRIDGIDGGVETVSFGPEFSAGGPALVRLRQAQVVYTLTQFPTVTRVRFGADGQPVGRDRYADLLPPIVVLDPVIGQRVTSPITITGSADVFEATVNVRLLDAEGRQLATAFTTATCGSGCRGDYRIRLAYRAPGRQAGIVEVYQVSPKDGSRRDVVAVPVRLAGPG
jgi:Immunoglobulin-like domain of bacterial spore germination/Sporulation and spore germination